MTKVIIECNKEDTATELKKWISKYRPCTYFVATTSDEAVNNGYQDIINERRTDFRKKNLIIIK